MYRAKLPLPPATTLEAREGSKRGAGGVVRPGYGYHWSPPGAPDRRTYAASDRWWCARPSRPRTPLRRVRETSASPAPSVAGILVHACFFPLPSLVHPWCHPHHPAPLSLCGMPPSPQQRRSPRSATNFLRSGVPLMPTARTPRWPPLAEPHGDTRKRLLGHGSRMLVPPGMCIYPGGRRPPVAVPHLVPLIDLRLQVLPLSQFLGGMHTENLDIASSLGWHVPYAWRGDSTPLSVEERGPKGLPGTPLVALRTTGVMVLEDADTSFGACATPPSPGGPQHVCRPQGTLLRDATSTQASPCRHHSLSKCPSPSGASSCPRTHQ